MKFHVLPYRSHIPDSPNSSKIAYLLADNWNDFGYVTQYRLVIQDGRAGLHEIGMLKIGQKLMDEDQLSPQLPSRFTELGQDYFSLGQDELYYTNLRNFFPRETFSILKALRDVAFDDDIFEDVLDEPVTGVSLLRFVEPETVRNQFHRILLGGRDRADFNFSFHVSPHENSSNSLKLDFDVTASSNPPTNTHVIIGRNGVGKTTILNAMASAFMNEAAARGRFVHQGRAGEYDNFAGIVSVAFSAFDPFKPIATQKNKSRGMTHTYIGLKKTFELLPHQKPSHELDDTPMMSRDELAASFGQSIGHILAQRGRRARWDKALATLSSDPVFNDESFDALAEYPADERQIVAQEKFDSLSSGHKIVLLTVVRLIESVQERTLVLIDEPEAHLHPPLLSALMTALSDLLSDRNGVAVIATHSPVVLQEVPKSCVSIIGRSGNFSTVQRPEIETFGENVGVLTREVFGLEVTNSGFHARLNEALEKSGGNYEAATTLLGSSLGAEARAILRTMSLVRKRGESLR